MQLLFACPQRNTHWNTQHRQFPDQKAAINLHAFSFRYAENKQNTFTCGSCFRFLFSGSTHSSKTSFQWHMWPCTKWHAKRRNYSAYLWPLIVFSKGGPKQTPCERLWETVKETTVFVYNFNLRYVLLMERCVKTQFAWLLGYYLWFSQQHSITKAEQFNKTKLGQML